MKILALSPLLGFPILAFLPSGCSSRSIAAIAAQGPVTVPAKTYVGPVPIGGLDEIAARKAVRAWWETRKREPLVLEIAGKAVGKATPSELGVAIADEV